MELKSYEHKALLFAERFGIIDYKVKGNKITYYESFRNEGKYKCIVNLDTDKERREQVLK